MGLLKDAAQRIVTHIKTRDDDRQLNTAIQSSMMHRAADLTEAYRRLMAGQGLTWASVLIPSPFRKYQSPEGSVLLGEVWGYPSVDLRMYVDRFGPYASDHMRAQRELEAFAQGQVSCLNWDVTLQVDLSAQSEFLPVAIPLIRLAWTDPRALCQKLKRFSTQEGYPTQKAFEEMFLKDFQQPDPDTVKREWRIHVSNKTPYKEVLTNLVIGAWKSGFPVVEEDQHTALEWVNSVIRDGFRRWCIDKETRQQWSDELAGVICQGLKDNFDLPASERSLRDYITETARGFKRDELKKNNPCRAEPYIDPRSGHRIYPDASVSQALGIHERTVRRWRGKRKITTPGLSEEQYADLREERNRKQEQSKKRKALRDYQIQAMGKRPATAKKWMQRHQKAGESVEDMANALLSRDG